MINDDRDRSNTHCVSHHVVCAREPYSKQTDLALNPFGMKRGSLTRSRKLQRAVSQALV